MGTSSGVAITGPVTHEVEVLAKATRRRFSAEYKLKILREAEACTQAGRSAPSWAARGCIPRT